MTNVINLSGTLVTEPDLRQTKTNKAFTNFRLKVDREESSFKDYITCICWDDQLAQQIAQQAAKDDEVSLTGSMRSNRYTNSNGVTCYSFEVKVDTFKLIKKAVNKPVQTYTAPMANSQPTMPQTDGFGKPIPNSQPAMPQTDGFGKPMPNSQPAVSNTKQDVQPTNPFAATTNSPATNMADDPIFK